VVSRVVLLDAGPLGLVTNPKQTSASGTCSLWVQNLLAAGARIIVPEIADYEVRRELHRAGKSKSIRKLDEFARNTEYLPLTTQAMHHAALLWAQIRQKGKPTAGHQDLDCDMILAAQALTFGIPNVIATTNLRHLTLVAPADLWPNIQP
jgi:predicted nucleic acid-binding protein